MPQFFHFWYHDAHHPDQDVVFNGQLQSLQCEFIKKDGERCRRRCVIGLPCCHSHLPIKYHVQVRNSLLVDGGKGLFAYDRTKEPNEIVFKGARTTRHSKVSGDRICPYYGEMLNTEQMDARYKHHTAPYGIEVKSGRFEDGALERGVGSLINHKPRGQANCEFTVSGNPGRVFLRAVKNIRNGEELYVSYGRGYKLNERGVVALTDNRKELNRRTRT
jgi:hypothetical protein